MARKLEVAIVGDASSFQRSLNQASKAGGGFGSKIAKVGRLAAIGLGIGAAAAGAAGVKMIGLASDAEEVESKFKIVFGKTVPRLTKQINAFSKATGASRFELKEQVADLGALLKPIIGNTRETGKMSIAVAQLATDLGSFNNVPVEEALLAIRSGLVGEAEPLRRFGVLLNESAVEAEGLRLGLIKQGETMTEGEKVRARYSLIMKQTALAQGDAKRTADSFANQLKRLKNSAKDAGTEIGKRLLPFATAVVDAFNDALPAIQKFLDKFGKAGFKMKLKIIWTGLREAGDDLLQTIREELFGEVIRKPLKLKTGKIIEWEEDRQTGLVKVIERGLRGADWTAIGKTIGDGISSRIKITAKFLENALMAINGFIDSHLDEFADTGAKMVLAILNKLLDPAFWARNWKLVLGIAVAVFPIGRFVTLGGKIAASLLGVVAKLLPAGFRTIGGRMVDVMLNVLGRLPGRVQAILLRTVTAAIKMGNRFIDWIQGRLKAALDRIPGWVKAAFRLGAILAMINAVKDLINWIQRIPDIGTQVPGGQQPRGPGSRPPRSNPNRAQGSSTSSTSSRGRYTILADQEFVDHLRATDQNYRRTNGGRGIFAT